MIELKDNRDCCGCSACVQKCPKQCITLLEDNEGFLYPQIDVDRCVDCNLCERVCPVINRGETRNPFKVYAAKSRNEVTRSQSSSGGIFTHLAEQVITAGGVVFGARFNDSWEVVHAYTDTIEGLAAFRGCKYVQSRIGNTFKEAQGFLKDGREVLYVGTPCQIAGLKLFLGKTYDKLLTVDFVCHGTPSPKVWRAYLRAVFYSAPIKGISFRDKTAGWRRYTIKVWDRGGNALLKELSVNNLYMLGFLGDVYLRPSCFHCPTKSLRSGSDITLGDYWKIWQVLPEFDDDKGVSLMIVNNPAKDAVVRALDVSCVETSFDDALLGNPSLTKSAPMCNPAKRHLFFEQMDEDVLAALRKATHVPLYARFILSFKQTVYRFLVFTKIRKV